MSLVVCDSTGIVHTETTGCENAQPLDIVCQWWVMCGNPATKFEPHPILGAVPICDRCAALVAGMS